MDPPLTETRSGKISQERKARFRELTGSGRSGVRWPPSDCRMRIRHDRQRGAEFADTDHSVRAMTLSGPSIPDCDSLRRLTTTPSHLLQVLAGIGVLGFPLDGDLRRGHRHRRVPQRFYVDLQQKQSHVPRDHPIRVVLSLFKTPPPGTARRRASTP